MLSQPGKIEVPRAHLSEALLPSRYLTGINVLFIQVDRVRSPTFNFCRAGAIQPAPTMKNIPERVHTPSSLLFRSV